MLNIARRFPVTMALLATTVGVFLLQHWLGGGMDRMAHLRLGALSAERVSEHGEYFRLIMPWFIHAGLVHLVLNGFALLQLGALVEVFWGGRRLLVYYALCGLVASLASALFNDAPYAVGASGAILGLAGLILGTSWYGASPVKDQLRELVGRQLLYGVLLTFALGFGLLLVLPVVDNWAHVGGFVAGLLIAGAVPDPTKEDVRHSLSAAGAALAGIISAFVWMGMEGGRALEPEGMVELARANAARVSSGRSANSPALIADMTLAFIRAGAEEEGLATLERALGRMTEPSEPAWVLMTFLALEDEVESPAVNRAYHLALRQTAERWVALAPDDPSALNAAAWELVQGPEEGRDPERAITLARRSLQRIPADDDMLRAMVLDTLAEAQLQTGNAVGAEATQAEAVELALAQAPTIWQRLGLAGSLPLEEMTARLERIRAAE